MLAEPELDQGVQGEEVAERFVLDTAEVDDDFRMWCAPAAVVGWVQTGVWCLSNRWPQGFGQCRRLAQVRIGPSRERPLQASRSLPGMHPRGECAVVKPVKVLPDDIDARRQPGVPKGVAKHRDQIWRYRLLDWPMVPDGFFYIGHGFVNGHRLLPGETQDRQLLGVR